MASKRSTIDFLAEQASAAGAITTKKMFGEFAVYCDGKLVALVCDNMLFVKPTDLGRAYIGADLIGAAPYPGAKAYFVVAADLWEDSEWLGKLIQITSKALPPAKRRSNRSEPINRQPRSPSGGERTGQ